MPRVFSPCPSKCRFREKKFQDFVDREAHGNAAFAGKHDTPRQIWSAPDKLPHRLNDHTAVVFAEINDIADTPKLRQFRNSPQMRKSIPLKADHLFVKIAQGQMELEFENRVAADGVKLFHQPLAGINFFLNSL